MVKRRRNGIAISIKKLVNKVLFFNKSKKVEKSSERGSLPQQTSSMVVIIDRILDEHRKQKVAPYSYDWIRYN